MATLVDLRLGLCLSILGFPPTSDNGYAAEFARRFREHKAGHEANELVKSLRATRKWAVDMLICVQQQSDSHS